MRLSSTRAGAAATAVLALAMAAGSPGCGPVSHEVDPSARYTPESLAEELAFRYRSLKPDARKFTRPGPRAARKPAELERARQADEKAEKKAAGAAVPKKQAGPATLDDIMADIDAKIDRIPAPPRPEACKKIIDALSKDATLSAEDKKLLSGRLEEMGAS